MWAATIVSTLFPLDRQGLIQNPKLQTTDDYIPFNIDELKRACSKQKSGKTPGPDGIPNEVIKSIEQLWPELLLKLFNKCFENSIFPKCWKKQTLVLLHKGNKPLNAPNSYRPLCMISSLGKLYESLLLQRLELRIGLFGGFSPKQYGFQKGKSTVNAIKNVIDIASTSKNNKGFCAIITLDVKNAFNSVRWSVVLDSLRRKGVRSYLYNIVADYLSDRVLMYHTDNGTKEYRITAGVPQGSVLGPFLWNVMYDEFLNQDLPTGAQLIGYADDVALVVTHDLPEAIEIIANDSLSRCDRWLTEHGLKLAAEKTEAILVTKRRIYKMPEIRVQGKTIKFSKSLGYLGIQLDRQLDFKEHVRISRDKAMKAANVLARIMPNNGGPKASTRKLINCVIHSKMLYAAPILKRVTENKSLITQLSRPQRMGALRVISGYRTISTMASLVLAGVPPIDLLITEREEIWSKLETEHTQRNENSYINTTKILARDNLIRKWQERWERDINGRWTYRLVPNLQNWIKCKHAETNYFLTQFLTGHGSFNAYLHRFKITDTPNCNDCECKNDTAEHAIFHCDKWTVLREILNNAIGVTLTPENMVNEMIKSERTWKLCQDLICRIMKDRCKQTTEPLISQEDGGVGDNN